MTKLRELIEEIVDDCTSGYLNRSIECFADLSPDEQIPLLAAVIEDNPDCDWSFQDALTDQELRDRLALFMQSKDNSTSAAILFKDYLKRMMRKTAAAYIDRIFEETWERHEQQKEEAYRDHGYRPISQQEVERIDFNRFCR